MDEINYLSILKWVIIVLIAGFIGQFGKSFAKFLMERTRQRKQREKEDAGIPEVSLDKAAEPATTPAHPVGTPPEAEAPQAVSLAPVDEKQAKEEAKKRKKADKALAKQKKKAAKISKKEGENGTGQ